MPPPGTPPSGRLRGLGHGLAASTSSSSSQSSTALPLPPKRGPTDPEYAALSELLGEFGEMDEAGRQLAAGNPRNPMGTHVPSPLASPSSAPMHAGDRRRLAGATPSAGDAAAQRKRHRSDMGDGQVVVRRPQVQTFESDEEDEEGTPRGGAVVPARSTPTSGGSGGGGVGGSKHTKLAELEEHVRSLERENLHLKQALLLGKGGSAAVLASRMSRDGVKQRLAERTKVVTDMVEQLNAAYLSLGDAARVWHTDCRIGVGVREWDARGRLETISLWNMIRSVFATIAVDIVELRPHLPDGEMMLTKWRIQGEIASPQQLEKVCASEDCPPTMRVALMAIKSSDLTFTVTTYVIFHELSIAEQHHCWDQVGVFKRLFGGEIPAAVVKILTVDPDAAAENDGVAS